MEIVCGRRGFKPTLNSKALPDRDKKITGVGEYGSVKTMDKVHRNGN